MWLLENRFATEVEMRTRHHLMAAIDYDREERPCCSLAPRPNHQPLDEAIAPTLHGTYPNPNWHLIGATTTHDGKAGVVYQAAGQMPREIGMRTEQGNCGGFF
jgi:hypothetical protein